MRSSGALSLGGFHGAVGDWPSDWSGARACSVALRAAWLDVLALDQLGDNPLETGLVTDHESHESSLQLSLLLLDPIVEALVTSSNFDHCGSWSEVKCHSVVTNKPEVVSYENDWYSDLLLIDGLVHILLQCISCLGFEFDWGFVEQSVALSLQLGITVVETNVVANPVLLLVSWSLLCFSSFFGESLLFSSNLSLSASLFSFSLGLLESQSVLFDLSISFSV